MMALYARELIDEMEEDHQNPAAAWMEGLLARRAAKRLIRRHGSGLLREILLAISLVPDFPPAKYLWNAAHPDVPVHCFLRIRREPVFRISTIHREGDAFEVVVEFGEAARGKASRRVFLMTRDDRWRLRCNSTSAGQA